jgi:hypothetical protein
MADPAIMVYTIDLYHLRAQPCKAIPVVAVADRGTAGFIGADPGIGTLDWTYSDRRLARIAATC